MGSQVSINLVKLSSYKIEIILRYYLLSGCCVQSITDLKNYLLQSLLKLRMSFLDIINQEISQVSKIQLI